MYIRTKVEYDDVMVKGTMLFALTLDDEVATIHIFQLLSFTYFMPVMLFISLALAFKRLILQLANNITGCRIIYSKSVVDLSQHCTKEIMALRFKTKISNKAKEL